MSYSTKTIGQNQKKREILARGDEIFMQYALANGLDSRGNTLF